MKEEGLLFSHDEQHTPLHEPLAGRPRLLIHHFANHLARKYISINRLRVF
jgi:hypothetical protein